MNVALLAAAVWRRKAVAVLLLLLVAIAGSVFLVTRDDLYESDVSVALLPRTDATGSTAASLPYYAQAVESLLPTYTQVIESGVVLEPVAADLGQPWTPDAVEEAIVVRTVPQSAIVVIAAQDPDPALAARVAQTTAARFVEDVASDEVLEARTLDTAQVPLEPVAPNRPLAAAAILLVALAVGVAGALAVDRLFGRVDTRRQAELATGRPVLGVLARQPALRGQAPRVVVGDPAHEQFDEQLRTLLADLLLALRQRPQHLVVVTGAARGHGTSTVVANLAVLLARDGHETLVVDADRRSPAQLDALGVPPSARVGSASSRRDGVHQTVHPHLAVTSTGGEGLPSAPRRVAGLLELADVVLVDAPAVDETADVRMLAAAAPAVLLVVKAGSMSVRQLREVVEDLTARDVDVVGTVLTGVRGAGAAAARPAPVAGRAAEVRADDLARP
ncbi:hypothetical protein [Kineococcus sp. SYSU DK006]|uniref:nucleotide-binding protein n=1 Tax=Kineococcus sp. SYSU DK006 TaxID=3383127 RepID=UPI003D7F10DD